MNIKIIDYRLLSKADTCLEFYNIISEKETVIVLLSSDFALEEMYFYEGKPVALKTHELFLRSLHLKAFW